MNSTGHAIKYGDNIDTDVIIPARYLSTADPEILAKYCMIDIDTTFTSRVRPGDIIIGGRNFGCGSSREHAPIAIKGSGISCVIAETFARIFYRNSFNIGLPIIECAEAAKNISDGDEINVDFETGLIFNATKNEHYQAEPLPHFMRNIINGGGLIASIKTSRGDV